MSLPEHFETVISEFHLKSRGEAVLIAVSGGVDSVVLTHLCKKAGITFEMAHCNFQLRGEESEGDERFVRTLAEKYNVPVHVKVVDANEYAVTKKLSIQVAAREIRYQYFNEIRSLRKIPWVFLAHHANDQGETVVMNFFRGTGLEGLTGMPFYNKETHVLRPLINVRRSEIINYARENNLHWREDSSNESNKYTRNFFRNELLPSIQKVFPMAEENIINNIKRLDKTNNLYKELVEGLKQKICVQKGEEVHMPILQLQKYQHTSLLFEIAREYGFTEKQVNEIQKLTSAESGKYVANQQFQVIKHRRWLIIAPLSASSETAVLEKHSTTTVFTSGVISLKIHKNRNLIEQASTIANLDAGELQWPLLLRKWKAGDYFYPLGMKKKKKLSRFFIDKKLSKSEKENTWVVESNKRICWVVGHRIDERFKVVDTTKEVVELSLSTL